MIRRRNLHGLVLTLSFMAPLAWANPWSEVDNPASGPARAIGEASAGCVRGARMLPLKVLAML